MVLRSHQNLARQSQTMLVHATGFKGVTQRQQAPEFLPLVRLTSLRTDLCHEGALATITALYRNRLDLRRSNQGLQRGLIIQRQRQAGDAGIQGLQRSPHAFSPLVIDLHMTPLET
jgi:hypothetical protein